MGLVAEIVGSRATPEIAGERKKVERRKNLREVGKISMPVMLGRKRGYWELPFPKEGERL